jgi:hypothetical protein
MVYIPNHIYVPVAYLAIVSSGYAFSAANPAYTLPGKKKKTHDPSVRLAHES